MAKSTSVDNRDRRITIQRKTVTQSDSGEPLSTWQTLAAPRIWANVRPVIGRERLVGPQLNALEQVEFNILYWTEIADLSPQDRIIYPALADGDPPPEPSPRNIYDVLAVHELGRREGLRITTNRRSDVP